MRIFMMVFAAFLTMASFARADSISNLVGVWKPSSDSARVAVGKVPGPNGWKMTTTPNFDYSKPPTFVIQEQHGRAVAGYMTNPDGSHQAFVAIIKRNGKGLIGSNEQGIVVADISGDEMDECWTDTLPDITAAGCNVLHRTKQ